MSTLVMIENAVSEFEIHVDELPRVSAAKIGLDVRAGYVHVDVDDQVIIVSRSSKGSLEYYGGFEYVEEEARYYLGEYTIYTNESSRVADALDYYEEHEGAA